MYTKLTKESLDFRDDTVCMLLNIECCKGNVKLNRDSDHYRSRVCIIPVSIPDTRPKRATHYCLYAGRTPPNLTVLGILTPVVFVHRQCNHTTVPRSRKVPLPLLHATCVLDSGHGLRPVPIAGDHFAGAGRFQPSEWRSDCSHHQRD